MKSDDLQRRPVSSVTAALDGSTPGVSVTANYGSPGSDPTIYIRGVGTVNGSTSPLYVIDGVPFGGNISDINMDDVESMSVLKDASAAALYGNRASNGVILITTKKSKSDRVNFTFKTNQGWYERALPEYETTNAKEFMQASYMNYGNAWLYSQNGKVTHANPDKIHAAVTDAIFKGNQLASNPFTIREADKLFNQDGTIVDGAEILPGLAGDLDWFDQATRKGYRAEYLFSGSGATQRSDYYFSIGYLDENGYMKDSGFERFTGRGVINMTPVKWLTTGINLSATHQKFQNTANGVGDGSSSYNNPFYFCRFMAPIYPVHTHYVEDGTYLDASGNPYTVNVGDLVDGSYDGGSYIVTMPDGTTQEISTRNQNIDRHVIWESQLDRNRSIRNTMNAIAYMDFNLPYGFIATIKGNLNTRNYENSDYGNAEIGDSKARGGSLSKTLYNYKNWTLMEQLRWNHTYGKHSIQFLFGHENYSYLYDYTYTSKSGQAFAGVPALENFSELGSSSGFRSRYRTESYLGRIQYNFDDRYNIEASVRRDGSSRFHKDSRWGTFGSVGVNWVITNEQFMKDLTWVNSAKLRAAWGQVGNDAGSGYYGYYSLFDATHTNSLPAYVLSQIAADDLKWETGESWGIGLEGRLFNRVNFSIEWYDKRNKDLIFSVYSPSSGGSASTGSVYPSRRENIGSISNRGLELSFDVDIVKTKDWTVNFGANLSTLKNKVTKLPDANKKRQAWPIDESMYSPRGILNGSQFIEEGRSRYEFYTYHWAGVDMMDGRSLYDANLIDYHIMTKDADGKDVMIGGSYKLDANGELDLLDNKPQVGSTELKPEDYRLINGKYYVVNTTYAAKHFCGTALPSVFGSFNANVRWKDITVQAMFSYSLGGKINDGVYSSLMSASGSPHNYHKDILNSWWGTPEGMTEDSPNRINPNINNEINYETNTQNVAGSDRWLVSRDYLCFKNLNVSYSLPRNWCNFLNLSRIQVSFSAENLHIWGSRKGMNPMMGLSGGQSNYLVPARVYTFGLNVNI